MRTERGGRKGGRAHSARYSGVYQCHAFWFSNHLFAQNAASQACCSRIENMCPSRSFATRNSCGPPYPDSSWLTGRSVAHDKSSRAASTLLPISPFASDRPGRDRARTSSVFRYRIGNWHEYNRALISGSYVMRYRNVVTEKTKIVGLTDFGGRTYARKHRSRISNLCV